MSFYSLDAAVVANGIGLKNKFHFPFPELQTQKTCFGTIKSAEQFTAALCNLLLVVSFWANL